MYRMSRMYESAKGKIRENPTIPHPLLPPQTAGASEIRRNFRRIFQCSDVQKFAELFGEFL